MSENPYEAPPLNTQHSYYVYKYDINTVAAWVYRGIMFSLAIASFVLFYYFSDRRGAEITASIGIIGSLADIITCLIVEKLNESQRRADIGSP